MVSRSILILSSATTLSRLSLSVFFSFVHEINMDIGVLMLLTTYVCNAGQLVTFHTKLS